MLLILFRALIMLLLGLIAPLVAPVATLNSIEKIDDHPLYFMHYYGAAAQNRAVTEALIARLDPAAADSAASISPAPASQPAWGCALYATWADPAHALYGRNFDWQFSPAMLVFYHPPDGYASVVMVDIAYSGFATPARANRIDELPLLDRAELLNAPNLPMDGMNEHGLAIAQAAVPHANQTPDLERPMIGSLGIMREVLDHARTVDEALAIFARFNIDWTGGPDLHYLVADATGSAALIEFVDGAMVVTQHPAEWDMATNFTRAVLADDARPEDQCWRYETISARLASAEGVLTEADALDLLGDVAQSNTQWSVVYSMATGAINVVMHRQYDQVYTFQLPLIAPAD